VSAARKPNPSRRRAPKARAGRSPAPIVVLKLGGELIESDDKLRAVGHAIVEASKQVALVIVHGGGREIDAALAQVGIPKRQADGLRITDEATLDVVVAVLAGSVNTHFVAAINAAGGRAVGLTGADAGVAPVRKAPLHRATSGDRVDLGLVGHPIDAPVPPLFAALWADGYVPVIACVSASRDGQLYNVNADTLAGSLAARLEAARLVIAGGTPGVLDAEGRTIIALGRAGMRRMVRSGTASAGMVAKLAACADARTGGVTDVVIVDGRDPARLVRAVEGLTIDAATVITD